MCTYPHAPRRAVGPEPGRPLLAAGGGHVQPLFWSSSLLCVLLEQSCCRSMRLPNLKITDDGKAFLLNIT